MKQSVLDIIKKAMDSFALPPDEPWPGACGYSGALSEGILSEKVLSEGKNGTRMAEDRKILTAVSGGADSVCLLLALRELGYLVHAIHVEHGIRGTESLEDCAFVQKLCKERSIPLSVVTVDVPAAAKVHSMSLEEAARTLRWKAFQDTAGRLGIRVLATAHHRMDQAETVLWNMIRGSSVGGLGGIRPLSRVEGLTVIRPMLECEREQIEHFLRQRRISWRTDSTNADTRMTRNAIRQKIMPLLEELNPGAAKHITQAASDLREVEDWLRIKTEEALERVILESGDALENDLTADRNALKTYPEVIRHRVLRCMSAKCLEGIKDISRVHVLALDRLAMGQNGQEVCLPDGVNAFSEEGILRLTRRRTGKVEDIVPLERDGSYYWHDTGTRMIEEGREPTETDDARQEGVAIDAAYIMWPGGEVPKKKYTKYLAYDTMAPCPVLRTRRPGDYLIVNSAGGRRKLKDYLIDEKVPRLQRDSIPLIAQGSHVLWVIGMRISEGAKVREGMKALKVSVCVRAEYYNNP